MEKVVAEGLTFDDVLLIPSYSEVLPSDVNISTRLTKEITINIPILRCYGYRNRDAWLSLWLEKAGWVSSIAV